MSVSDADVKKIAKLARLRLSEAEVALYGGQLTKILDAMTELGALDTKDVPPTKERFHTLQISLSDPRLQVKARNGYYGEAESAAPVRVDSGPDSDSVRKPRKPAAQPVRQ